MRRIVLVLLGIGALLGAPVQAQTSATRGVLDAFATHRLVLLGESHRSPAFHRFLRELVETPEFPRRVNDIVVEFGNARYQPILDRYIAGGSVRQDSLQLVWRTPRNCSRGIRRCMSSSMRRSGASMRVSLWTGGYA